MAVRTFCALSMYPYSYLYHTSYAIASLILALVGIYLYIWLSLAKIARCTAASFQVFLCQYVYELTVWNVVYFLARSSISCSHCGRLQSCNFGVIVLFCLLLFLFCCFLVLWPLPSRHYCFHCLGCRAVLRFSPPFLILAAILIAVPFSSLPSILSLFSQTAIIAAFHSRLDLSFVGLPFLLRSCCCHIHLAAKDSFVVTTGCRPFYLLFWLSFLLSFSCCHLLVAVPIVTIQPIAIHIL